ncbi:putative Ig domain-containing protein [Candidatus Woesearchaeota archaeon]|nr:putative Ig domain-containing protein [Candidatus Woesearchaeota archaeon]
MDYAFSFCDNPAALDCTSSYSVSGGAGAPYTFSAAGLPLGLFLSPNGELSGKIPKEAQEGERTFRVCAIDSARVEDCKDVKLSIKKNTALKYRLVLKSTKTYSGEVVNFNYCGGSAKEDGSIIFEIDEVIVLTQPPSSWNQNTPYTSNEYDVITDEYGYTSTDNVRHLQVPMKASGSAATSYDFCEYSTTECNSDSFSASYGIKVPIEMTLDASGLTVYIDNPYVKDNPHLEAGDISQMTCSSPGIAEYILKKMAVESPFVRENSYRKAVFDANGGTLAGQYEDMNPYTYAFGAASGRTSRHLEWTLAVEIIK